MKRYTAGLLLSLSSFSGVLLCYVLASQDIPFVEVPSSIYGLLGDNGVFLIRNLLAIILVLFISVWSIKLAKTNYSNAGGFIVAELKPIESVAVPTYIGLFVIAIELAGIDIAGSIIGISFSELIHVLILLMLFVFWIKFERIFYFNPIWLLHGYRFYEVRATDGNTYTLVTRRNDMKVKLKFDSLMRINNYTYMEMQ